MIRNFHTKTITTLCLAAVCSLMCGCAVVAVATTAVNVGVTVGSVAVSAATTVVKGTANVAGAIADKVSDGDH